MQAVSKARHREAAKALFSSYPPARGALPYILVFFLIWCSDQTPNVFYDLAGHTAAIIEYLQT